VTGLPPANPAPGTAATLEPMTSTRTPAPVERFEAERPRLVGLAYRILGSRIDAEDIVQEAWLRYERTDPTTIDAPAAWLTTVVSRLALDQLRSARHRREAYVGPWLPEFVRSPIAPNAGPDPEAAAELAESLTLGFLRVLETLGPIERVVFLLADVFDVPHAQIAEIIDRSPAAARQIASRARRRVRDERPLEASGTPHPDDGSSAVVEAMIAALATGELDRILRLLADDAVLISDGGASVKAARRPVVGADRVARFLANLANRGLKLLDAEITTMNNGNGVVLSWFGVTFAALVFEATDGRITEIDIMRNPDKLAALDLAGPFE
jgi:RNA polymerase sigma-70 factor (ECF subfamily)